MSADAVEAAPARPTLRLVAGLGACVVALAVAGYATFGSPSLAGWGAGPAVAAAAAPAPESGASDVDPRTVGLQQIATMVDSLAARMKERPDDAEGWTMLARSYTVLGRFAEALPAYARAIELEPKNAGLLADYADAVAATKGTVANPESSALIARALAADPNHPKALALAGTAAYDRADYTGAIRLWQRIADALPADSELRQQVQSSIVEARQRAGGDAPVAAGAVSNSASAVSGVVSIDTALAARAAPDDLVFVFARAAEGPRMPLAVLRARVAELPLTFRLDDSMAMAPNARLSGARSVVVGARISKTGNATPQPGDLAGESAPVAPGASGLAIRIDKVVEIR